MPLNNLPLAAVWCDFNACGWSQEDDDTCYYVFDKRILNQIADAQDHTLFAYMPENSEETVFIGLQVQLEPYQNMYRLRPIAHSWVTGTRTVIEAALARPLLVVNNQKVAVYQQADMHRHLRELPQDTLLELCMEAPGGPWLCCLTHKACAWLMFIRYAGDPGLSSRGLHTDNGEMVSFQLSNGQLDEYPRAWTIPLEQAYAAVAYFWETQEPLPSISWHDDSMELL